MPVEKSSGNTARKFTRRNLSDSAKQQVDAIATRLNVGARKRETMINRALRSVSSPCLLNDKRPEVRAQKMDRFRETLSSRLEVSDNHARKAECRSRDNGDIANECTRLLRARGYEHLKTQYDDNPRAPTISLVDERADDKQSPVISTHPLYSSSRAADRKKYRIERLQTYIAELLLKRFPDGLEMQVAMAKDGKAVMIASNKNVTNQKMAKHWEGANVEALLDDLLSDASFPADGSLNQNDRAQRHAVKLRHYWKDCLSADAKVFIANRKAAPDGKHAELRIQDDSRYRDAHLVALFYQPTGTREPCIACAASLYEPSPRTTMVWPTVPSREALGVSKMKPGEAAEKIVDSFAKLIAQGTKFSPNSQLRGQHEKGSPVTTAEMNADSDSDLDEEVARSTARTLSALRKSA
jgi:hypothetical protein